MRHSKCNTANATQQMQHSNIHMYTYVYKDMQ
jgi:hypothetical protein